MMIKNLIRKFTPSFLLSWYHFLLAFLAAVCHRFPSQRIKVIGVTGTNGKSTVVDLTSRVLEQAGFKTASLSSIRFKIGKKEWQNDLKMTMPGRFKIQQFLRQAKDSNCQYMVLEVTSEGIKQHRHRFIKFDAAVFTNLTPEHIESHGGFENYKRTKGKLFQGLVNGKWQIVNSKKTAKISIVNLDDDNAEYFLDFPADKKFGYGLERNEHKFRTKSLFTVYGLQFTTSENGISFEVQNTKFNLKLLGNFNIYNALAAICVGLSQGINLETCRLALEKVKGIPGRMEVVVKEPFKVIVDYAFTPNALEKVYQTLKKNNQRMICVLGACGGGRDKWKRPVLGKIAAEYCDEIIITNEDPYNEDPYQILSQIKSGISKSQFPMTNFYEILDRREAIRRALKLAKPSDTVVITGKGCEPWICVAGGKKIPWDDRKVVREEFKKLY